MNVFSLFAKIGLDTREYEASLKGAKSKFSGFADGLKSAAGKVGDVLAGIGKAAAAGVGAASTALTALTKKSLDAVADYEQLVGGVDKIFGESSKKVQEYANQAYSEAGLSANQYMETVTSFSASLLQSLGNDTDAAADAANRAIIDMADNVNTYGSSMESVQNAYQGFAKANYTMLDNLKLGYGGTQEEMARLIKDAAQMNEEMAELGITVDADSMSFGNVVNAISVMQKHMNIAGTTHNEAAKTISGSIASMKAAWQNFLTGTGSPAQFTKILKDVVTNIRTNLNEILPRLTDGLTALADQIAPEIPPIIEQTLPSFITGASTLVTGLAKRLPDLLSATLPALSEGVVSVSTALVSILPDLVTSLSQSIPIIVRTIWSKKDELLEAGKRLISAVLPTDISKLPHFITSAASVATEFAAAVTAPQNLNKLTDKAFDIIGALISGLTSSDTLNAFFDEETGVGPVIKNLVDALVHFVYKLEDAADDIIKNIGNYLKDEENRARLWETAKQILIKLGSGLIGSIEHLAPFIVDLAEAWAEMFIGDIDYDGTASQILSKLGQAFVNNIKRGPSHLGEFIYDISHGIEEEREAEKEAEKEVEKEKDVKNYQSGTRMLPGNVAERVRQMEASGAPAIAVNEYLKSIGISKSFATGFYANRPTILSGVQVGESGAEALLPLESNTEWMDKLAAKIGGGGVHIENLTVDVHVDELADDYSVKQAVNSMISEISEQLAELQIRENRGIGLPSMA
ncbi:MAG: hypothetical protein IJL32_09355 [Oscillospiraceae bacterium]|nr:hypothetical protein [Oscillospiraceae bacterium]